MKYQRAKIIKVPKVHYTYLVGKSLWVDPVALDVVEPREEGPAKALCYVTRMPIDKMWHNWPGKIRTVVIPAECVQLDDVYAEDPPEMGAF